MKHYTRPKDLKPGDTFYDIEVVNMWVVTEQNQFVHYEYDGAMIHTLAYRITECTMALDGNYWTRRYMLKGEVTEKIKSLFGI